VAATNGTSPAAATDAPAPTPSPAADDPNSGS
jgi:hypothetical protein